MKHGGLGVILALFVIVALSLGQTPSGSDTGLKGIVTIRPVRPGPTKVDEPDSAPLSNCVFNVQNTNGVVTSFTTDAQGQFQISLPPGHYTVSMKERRLRHCGPFEVDITAGKMTNVEWRCDTGIR